MEALSAKYKRTDVVFDVYLPWSLKSETREKRGQGIRKRVTGISKTPKNWQSFLRDGNNKTELFYFLADKIAEISTSHTIAITKGDNVVSNQLISSENLAPCSHEEADTCIFVHARHAAMEGNKALVIKANDTDVLVIAIATLPSLQELGLQKMWITFGQGSSLRCIAVHDITSAIGPEKMRGLFFFHAFTGCDVTSAFRGKGKKSVWLTWDVCAEASDVFKKLSQYPPTVTDEDLKVLEKFVITMYDRSSTTTCVNDTRLDIFARKQRSYKAIPQTQSALLQHTKRAAYQAGCV